MKFTDKLYGVYEDYQSSVKKEKSRKRKVCMNKAWFKTIFLKKGYGRVVGLLFKIKSV